MIVQNDVMYLFDLLLGTWQLQLGMAVGQGMAFLISSTEDVNLTENFRRDIQFIRLTLIVMNMLSVFYLIQGKLPMPKFPYLISFLGVIIPTVSLILFVQIFVLTILIIQDPDIATDDPPSVKLVNSLFMNNFAYMATFLVSFLYLSLRFFFKTKIEPDIFNVETYAAPEEETAKAHRNMLDLLFNAFVPTVATEFLMQLGNSLVPQNSQIQDVQLQFIRISGWTNSFIIIVVVFCDYKRGGSCFTKYAPKVFMFMIWFSYLVLPWVNLTFEVFSIINGSLSNPGDLLQNWCIVCNVLWVSNFFEYAMVHNTIIYQLRTYTKIRREIEQFHGKKSDGQILQIMEEEVKHVEGVDANKQYLLQNIKNTYLHKVLPYPQKQRRYGEGNFRLNKTLELGNDVYSQCFNSMVTTYHIMMFIDPDTGNIVMDEQTDPDTGETIGGEQDRRALFRFHFKGEKEREDEVHDHSNNWQKIEDTMMRNYCQGIAESDGGSSSSSSSFSSSGESDDEDADKETPKESDDQNTNDVSVEVQDKVKVGENSQLLESQIVNQGEISQLQSDTAVVPLLQDQQPLTFVPNIQNEDDEPAVADYVTKRHSKRLSLLKKSLKYQGQEINDKFLQRKEEQMMLMRMSYFSNMLLCSMIQLLEIAMIGLQLYLQYLPRILTLEINALSLFMRMFLGLMLHFSLMDDVRSSLNSAKFALNHSYLFYSPSVAFVSQLLKFFGAFATEILNVIFLMSTFSPLSLINNFVALQVISQFPYLMQTVIVSNLDNLNNELVRDHVLVTQFTTSKNCHPTEFSEIYDEFGKPRPLKVTFRSRSCSNKCMFLLYRVVRFIFVTIYYYYIPFLICIASMFLPAIFGDGATNDGTQQ